MRSLSWIELSLLLGLWAWVSGLVNLLMNLRFVHTLDSSDASGEGPRPRVSILVPARNEEAAIGEAVDSFCRQSYQDVEVIVVDDRSDDRTGEILHALADERDNLRVLKGEEPPDGWLGKAWALELAQRQATGEWLLLIDADSVLEADAVKAAVARAEREGVDMMSGIVDYRRESFWEELLLSYFRNLQLTITRLARFLPPRIRSQIAVGAFILIRREAYDVIGGHEAIRDVLPNDVAVAKAVAKAGRSWEFLFLDRMVHWRMYRGFDEVWNGFRKNWYPMTGGSPVGFVVHLLFVVTQLAPWVALAALLAGIPSGGLRERSLVLASVTFATFVLLALTIRIRFRAALWTIPLYPVAVVVFLLIALRSAWSHVVTGRVEWRGRMVGR